jgi:hypothetical protein
VILPRGDELAHDGKVRVDVGRVGKVALVGAQDRNRVDLESTRFDVFDQREERVCLVRDLELVGLHHQRDRDFGLGEHGQRLSHVGVALDQVGRDVDARGAAVFFDGFDRDEPEAGVGQRRLGARG